jgi:phosphatidylglycerol---prolipoprotein diacylglyceryl transferase
MYPIICKIGPLTIYSYGLMLAVAALVCAMLLSRDAKGYSISAEAIFDLTFWTVLGGIIGARIFYIFLNLNFFLYNPLEMVMVQRGGLAWQGGLVLGTVAALGFIRRRHLPLLLLMELSAPYIALGQAIGRLGCFFNGCCYGRAVSWGIYFPTHGSRLHPTQLYDAAGLLFIFGILKIAQRRPGYQGSNFALYLMLASLLRFGVEFFRADHTIVRWGLSIYQLVSLGVGILGMLFYTFLSSRSERISK